VRWVEHHDFVDDHDDHNRDAGCSVVRSHGGSRYGRWWGWQRYNHGS
jgi:hypothetical protein